MKLDDTITLSDIQDHELTSFKRVIIALANAGAFNSKRYEVLKELSCRRFDTNGCKGTGDVTISIYVYSEHKEN